jgi:amino acid transporter
MNVWKRIAGKPALMSNVVLSVFGGGKVQHEGVARVLFQAGDQKMTAEIFVTSGRSTPILGLKACLTLGIIQAGDNHNPSLIGSVALSNCKSITMDTLT